MPGFSIKMFSFSRSNDAQAQKKAYGRFEFEAQPHALCSVHFNPDDLSELFKIFLDFFNQSDFPVQRDR